MTGTKGFATGGYVHGNGDILAAPERGSIIPKAQAEKFAKPLLEALNKKQLVDYPIHDAVNHPSHYVSHPSGVECIQVTEHMGFCLGNALKYIWRADLKNDAEEDLRKAIWYIERELDLRARAKKSLPEKEN